MSQTSNNKTMEQMLAEERERDAKWAAETKHGDYTIAELRGAFAKVQPAGNWKLPIDATIPADQLNLTKTAIAFMVGGPTEVRYVNGAQVRLLNAGYYRNIGA